MAKRRRNKNNNPRPTDLAKVEATAKKLQSLLVTPPHMNYIQSGALRGVRQKFFKINFDTIRNVTDRIPLANAIINTRSEQILPYVQFTQEEGEEGFTFERADGEEMKDDDWEQAKQLSEFLDQTGFQYDPEREDDFSDYCSMFVRETLVIDQIATEIQRNRMGDVAAFWLLDGGTIKRADPKLSDGQIPPNVRYVQEIDNKIYNQYTPEDLIFDYKFKRADIRFRGWGYSPIEQAIDLITTLLFGYNYVRDQLIRDKVPKGFISVMGDVGATQLDSIRRYWHAAMTGAGGQWNVPILPSGKEGVGVDFKTIGPSSKDMEYHKLMMFVSSVVAAVFSIDLAELGIKADDSTALIGETAEPRIQASKDRGLMSMLAFLEQHVNKIVRKVTTDYRFKFVGLVKEDERQLAELRAKALATDTTINELREQQGKDKIEEEYADVVLNPHAVQLYQASKGMAGGEGGGAFGGGEMGEEGEEAAAEETPEEEEPEEVDWESIFQQGGPAAAEKSLADFLEKTDEAEREVRYLIE